MTCHSSLARFTLGLLSLTFIGQPASAETDSNQARPKRAVRSFQFDYQATLRQLPPGTRLQAWLPVPRSSVHQQIKPLEVSLPAAGQTHVEPKYGNKILYFETKVPESGELALTTSYQVTRHEVRGLSPSQAEWPPLTAEEARLFLSANRKVPLSGKPLDLLAGMSFSNQPLATAKALYHRVDDHVRYDKSQPGYGHGDVLWVCDSRFGNCTDFHSLFISLARSQGLPARFEIGFMLPPEQGQGKIGGYHCWAFFHTKQHGWVPVDISEADKHPELKPYYFGNLTADRLTMSVGRDLVLVPRQAGPPLNYFIYPYVEIDGTPLARDQVELAFGYRDTKITGKPNRN